MVAAQGFSAEAQAGLRAVSGGDESPVGQAIRAGTILWIRTPAEFRAKYPRIYDRVDSKGETLAWAAIALRHRDENVGALLLVFSTATAVGVTDQVFTALLAGATADALHRAGDFDDEREARRDAEQLAQTRAEVLGVVAHDLRNPLSLIGASNQFLLEESLTPERRELLLKTNVRAVHRMNRLIGDLLDATRLEAGHLKLACRDIDARDVVHQVIESCRAAADQHNVTLTALVPDKQAIILADEDRLVQALGNLVGNALKFTGASGRVEISLAPAESEVLFLVRDTGPGIPAESLPRIFERFWQARDGDRRGIGLGLAITKGIIEAHGGRIWVESTPGAGSIFSFAIPTGADSPRQRESRSLAAAT